MRGEYFRLLSARSEPLELPPRARRIRGVMFATYVSDGTTSACAENTLEGWPETLSFWNYLRVRGEYNPARSTSQSEMELPPRARRIPNGALCTLKMKGTTSACAENTSSRSAGRLPWWNYLRVRGEYHFTSRPGMSLRELPPRARRIPPVMASRIPRSRTTSACAENTLVGSKPRCSNRNYLRVRGEYLRKSELSKLVEELPPRARRIPISRAIVTKRRGTTSACAENTVSFIAIVLSDWNYLRVRGEYSATPP